jgi:hypothetical protein
MKRFWLRRLFIFSVIAFGILGSSLLLVCWHYGIWSLRDWEIYQEMSRECHPVWKDLHSAKVHLGQPVEEVIALTWPVHVERFENFVFLDYQQGWCFTGVRIIAKNGRLISAQAGSCTWQRTFFEEWTDGEQEALWGRYSAHLERRVNQME